MFSFRPREMLGLPLTLGFLAVCAFNTQIATSENLPHWSQPTVSFQKCPLDSPEIYFDLVYQHKLKALLNEGNAFFGSLLEALERALPEDFKKSVEEQWISTSEKTFNKQTLSGDTIKSLWSLFIGRWEGGMLPWERRLRMPVLIELLSAIGTEHLQLRDTIHHGIQGILKPIQPYVGDVLKRIDAKLRESGGAAPKDPIARLGEVATEVEPTFVGKLLVATVKRNASGQSFVSDVLEEIAIVIEAFRTRVAQHRLFWTEMTLVLAKDIPKEQAIFHKYMTSEDEILKTMIQILEESLTR